MPGVLGAAVHGPITIAYTCAEKKNKFFRAMKISADEIPGLRLVHVDELKGETYHALLHKRTDDLVAALNGCQDALDRIRRFKAMLPEHVVPVDKVKGVNTLIDRASMARSIENALERTPTLNSSFRNLRWAVVPLDARADDILDQFQYPVIMKRRLACGSAESHHMAICQNPAQALEVAFQMGIPGDEVNGSVFVQEFVPDHGGILFKLYSIGERVDTQARRSVKAAPNNSTMHFDSQLLSKEGVALNMDIIEECGVEMLPLDLARKVADMMRRELDLGMIGIDVIYDVEKEKYCICDVNYFPGYKGVKDANRSILLHAAEKVRERRRLANAARNRSAPSWNRGTNSSSGPSCAEMNCSSNSTSYQVDGTSSNAY